MYLAVDRVGIGEILFFSGRNANAFFFLSYVVGRSLVSLHNSGEGRLRIPGFVFICLAKKKKIIKKKCWRWVVQVGEVLQHPARVSLQLKDINQTPPELSGLKRSRPEPPNLQPGRSAAFTEINRYIAG